MDKRMKKSTLWRLTFEIIFLFLACSPLFADSQSYAKYCNDRYGFCIEYPKTLAIEPPPENGDGRRFHDEKGFLVIASGINNVLDDTLNGEMSSQSRDFDKITYRAKGKNWFILSGYKGSDVLYIKTYVGKGVINHLYIKYPSKRSGVYDEIVSRISRSFKPGDLGDLH
jgi:hypothetical protein